MRKFTKNLTKKDGIHFIIYKYLDLIGVKNPYRLATYIIDELKDKNLLK